MDKLIGFFVLYAIAYYTVGPYVFPDDSDTPMETAVVEQVEIATPVDARKAFLRQLNHFELNTRTQETTFAFDRHFDSGVRVRYFRDGLYVVSGPRQTTPLGARMVAAAAEGRIAEAPGYKGHYFVENDGSDDILVHHGGGKTPPVTASDKTTIRGLCGYPAEDAFDNYRRWKKRNGIGS